MCHVHPGDGRGAGAQNHSISGGTWKNQRLFIRANREIVRVTVVRSCLGSREMEGDSVIWGKNILNLCALLEGLREATRRNVTASMLCSKDIGGQQF